MHSAEPDSKHILSQMLSLVNMCVQLRALLLANNEAKSPNTSAAVIPAAPAVNPPVNIPILPSFSTDLFTPSAIRHPNPVSGTDAPAPAKSISGRYIAL